MTETPTNPAPVPLHWFYDRTRLELPPHRRPANMATADRYAGPFSAYSDADHARRNALQVERLRDSLRPAADKLPPEFAPAGGWPAEPGGNPSPERVQSWGDLPAPSVSVAYSYGKAEPIYLPTAAPLPTRETDALAQLIRQVDGRHDLGAGALAEALYAHGVRLYTVARDEAEDTATREALERVAHEARGEITARILKGDPDAPTRETVGLAGMVAEPVVPHLTQTAAHLLADLAGRMVTGEAVADAWGLEYEAEPVGLSGEPVRTGHASLTLQFTEPERAAAFRDAVAAAKPPAGVTIPAALFERLRLHAAVRVGVSPVDFQCEYCGRAAGEPHDIGHALGCVGVELERLAALERQG